MESQDRVRIVEKAKSIIETRDLIATGRDSEGNRPSPLAWEVLKHLEAELGQLAAEWIATHSHLVLET